MRILGLNTKPDTKGYYSSALGQVCMGDCADR